MAKDDGFIARLARAVEDLGSAVIPPKVFIYMNDLIKDAKNKEPVIAVQIEGQDKLVYTNKVEILDAEGRVVARVVFNPAGLATAPFHKVRAWVETRHRIRVS